MNVQSPSCMSPKAKNDKEEDHRDKRGTEGRRHSHAGPGLLPLFPIPRRGGAGTVCTGCNVENAAYPAGICAERNAISHAVAEGHTRFRRIVIAGRGEDFCTPCGICRQVMREFAPDLEVICLNGAGEERVFTLPDLLPHSFGPESL